MKFNIDKMLFDLNCFEELGELKYFKQFNVYENVKLCRRKLKIYNIESTPPNIEVYSIKAIDTLKGSSLEGQHLSGKKLIIVGNINLNLILYYDMNYKKNKDTNKKNVVKVNIPFSTFIIIPQDICNIQEVNLRYLIEDVTVTPIDFGKVFVSVTILIQYVDEY